MNDPLTASRRNLLVGSGIGAAGLFGMTGPSLATAAPMAFVPPDHDASGVTWWLRLDGIVGESLDDDERARRTVDRFIADLEANSQEKV